MKTTLSRTTVLLLSVVALLSAGCRANRHAAELLERENRLLEDKIYELEDVIEDYKDALERRDMADASDDDGSYYEPARRTDSYDRDDADDSDQLSDAPKAPRMVDPGPSRDRDDRSSAPPSRLAPPVIEFPDEDSGTDKPEPGSPFLPEVPKNIEGPTKNFLPPTPDTDDASTLNEATHLKINADLCGGYDDDNKPGDDGINVSLEPRNARGRAVGGYGDLIVVVRDPRLSGPAAYVARWEFTAEQLAEVFGASADGEMNLTLAWPDRRPSNESLDLYVRYITPDGRKLDAKEPIDIRLADSYAGHSSSDGWTVARNPIRRRPMEREPAIMVPSEAAPAEISPASQWVVQDEQPRREPVIQAVHEEPVTEERPTELRSATESRPAWSPNRP